MKVYIMTDIEGISGVYSRSQVLPGEWRFSDGRSYMTRDVNICAKALKEAGVEKVIVQDCHGGSYSLIWSELNEYVDEAICGDILDERFYGVDECDAVILLGYHAMAGTLNALLDHTMSSVNIQNYWINGKKVGEIGIDASIVGEHQKPVIMVSGDTLACKEAKEFLPWAVTAEVKRSIARQGAGLYPPQKSKEILEKACKEAVENFKNGKTSPYKNASPITMRIELTEGNRHPLLVHKPYINVIDSRTWEMEADSVEQALLKL